jgi:hypothetical protein
MLSDAWLSGQAWPFNLTAMIPGFFALPTCDGASLGGRFLLLVMMGKHGNSILLGHFNPFSCTRWTSTSALMSILS